MCVCVIDWQEVSSHKVTSDNQRSSASMGLGELQPKQDSQEFSEALQQEQSSKAISYMHMYQIIF